MVDVAQPLLVTWYNNISGASSITLTILNEATISIDNAEIVEKNIIHYMLPEFHYQMVFEEIVIINISILFKRI